MDTVKNQNDGNGENVVFLPPTNSDNQTAEERTAESSTAELREVARRYREARLNVLPADRKLKRPIGKWKEWTKTVGDFDSVFPKDLQFDALAVVCGATSGGLEVVDFDQKAKAFDEFKAAFGSLDGFPVESTQSGGKHIAFRSNCFGRNQKLALDEKDEVLIETRGEGGICLIAPSDGYQIESGDWASIPTLESDERARLLDVARSLNKGKKEATKRTATASKLPVSQGAESASDYLRANPSIVRDALARAGWKFLYSDEKESAELYARPNQSVDGKPGGSLHFDGDKLGAFHVFTSNAPGFDVDGNYSPLQVVARLEFGGDESAAARAYAPKKRNAVIDCINRDELATPNNEITISTANQSAPTETRAQRKRRQLDQLAELDLLSAVPDFPAWAVPKSLLDYCEAQSKATLIPVPALVAMSLADFSGLVARLFPIPYTPLGRKKLVFLNFAVLALAGSGEGKSDALGIVGEPISRIRKIVAEEWAEKKREIEAREEREEDLILKQKRLYDERKRANSQRKDEIDNELNEIAAELYSKKPKPPKKRIVSDKPGTPEAADKDAIYNLSFFNAPIFRAAEASTFFSARYNKGGDLAQLETYSELWDATTDEISYKNQERVDGLEIPRMAAFNLATQDRTYKNCFKDETKREQGFNKRPIFVELPPNEKHLPFVDEREDPLLEAFCVPYLRAYASCVLMENGNVLNEEAETRRKWALANGGKRGFDLYFDFPADVDGPAPDYPCARLVFKEFSDYIQDRKRELREEGRFETRAAYSKLFTNAEKLTGLLFAWEYLEANGATPRIIEFETAKRGVALAHWYGLYREAIEQKLDFNDPRPVFSLPTICTVLAKKLAKEPSKAFSKSELVKGIKSLEGKKNAATFEKCVATLVEKEYCRIVRETRGNNEREYYQYIPESADAEELEGGENE